tara:strand:- start:417 stop:650 length:234 start_codon:yes stop_codon:yes gene_type:complete
MIKNLTFPISPFIYRYIAFDYNETSSVDELIEVWHKWQRVINFTNSGVKKKAFISASNALYSELTNQSFETKKFKTL